MKKLFIATLACLMFTQAACALTPDEEKLLQEMDNFFNRKGSSFSLLEHQVRIESCTNSFANEETIEKDKEEKVKYFSHVIPGITEQYKEQYKELLGKKASQDTSFCLYHFPDIHQGTPGFYIKFSYDTNNKYKLQHVYFNAVESDFDVFLRRLKPIAICSIFGFALLATYKLSKKNPSKNSLKKSTLQSQSALKSSFTPQSTVHNIQFKAVGKK